MSRIREIFVWGTYGKIVKCQNHESSTENKWIHGQAITRHWAISLTWGSRNSPYLFYKKTHKKTQDKMEATKKKLEAQRSLYRWPGFILQYSFTPFPNNATSIIFPIGSNAKEWPSMTAMLKIRSASKQQIRKSVIQWIFPVSLVPIGRVISEEMIKGNIAEAEYMSCPPRFYWICTKITNFHHQRQDAKWRQ